MGTVAAGRVARLVWENEVGGLTYEVGTGSDRCFVKWTPTSSGIELGKEAARLVWAARKPSVVYASSISCSGGPMWPIWKKWSITPIESKPALSAVVEWSRVGRFRQAT